MITGMMWFDNNPKTALPEKIQRAGDYYKDKYGGVPAICYLNPSMLSQDQRAMTEPLILSGMAVRIHTYILPHNLWIGESTKGLDK